MGDLNPAAVWNEFGAPVLQSLAVLVGAAVVWVVATNGGRRWLATTERRLADQPALETQERMQRLRTLWAVARTAVAIALLVVVALTIFAIWGVPIGPVLAVGSVVGVAVGFGAQNVIRDVIAGFLIIAENQYAIGDVVEIAGVGGDVEEIRLRVTVLRDLDGKVHYVPNGAVRVATNLTQEFSRVVIDVSVGYDADVDEALAVVADEARRLAEDDGWSEAFVTEPQLLGVNELGDSAVTIRVVFATVPARRWAAKREFLRRVKRRLDAEGIEIPYPYRNVVLRGDVTSREAPSDPEAR